MVGTIACFFTLFLGVAVWGFRHSEELWHELSRAEGIELSRAEEPGPPVPGLGARTRKDNATSRPRSLCSKCSSSSLDPRSQPPCTVCAEGHVPIYGKCKSLSEMVSLNEQISWFQEVTGATKADLILRGEKHRCCCREQKAGFRGSDCELIPTSRTPVKIRGMGSCGSWGSDLHHWAKGELLGGEPNCLVPRGHFLALSSPLSSRARGPPRPGSCTRCDSEDLVDVTSVAETGTGGAFELAGELHTCCCRGTFNMALAMISCRLIPLSHPSKYPLLQGCSRWSMHEHKWRSDQLPDVLNKGRCVIPCSSAVQYGLPLTPALLPII